MAEQTNSTARVPCRFLTCKEMFYKESVAGELPHSGSGHFWCALTQRLQGPDDKIAGREECGSHRSCYQES